MRRGETGFADFRGDTGPGFEGGPRCVDFAQVVLECAESQERTRTLSVHPLRLFERSPGQNVKAPRRLATNPEERPKSTHQPKRFDAVIGAGNQGQRAVRMLSKSDSTLTLHSNCPKPER